MSPTHPPAAISKKKVTIALAPERPLSRVTYFRKLRQKDYKITFDAYSQNVMSISYIRYYFIFLRREQMENRRILDYFQKSPTGLDKLDWPQINDDSATKLPSCWYLVL